jgi:hypothetical protein
MRCLLVVGAAVFAVAGVSSVAEARPLAGDEFHNEFNETVDDFCDVPGMTVEIDTVFDGRFSVKTKGRDGLAYFAQHIRIASTYTAANGNVVTSLDQFHDKDLKVIDNGDGTLTVIFFRTGNATFYGANGKAIGRDPGQVRFELLVDHNGTPGDPLDDILLSEEIIKGSTGRSDDFCEVVVPALT